MCSWGSGVCVGAGGSCCRLFVCFLFFLKKSKYKIKNETHLHLQE